MNKLMVKIAKNLLLLVLVGIFGMSCQNFESSKERQRKKTIQDSISIVQEINSQLEQARIDSIQKEEEMKVIGDINFGISNNEFEKLKNELKEECKVLSWESGNSKFYDYKIGEFKFTDITGNFYEDKLYFVQIRGQHTTYQYYDETMKSQAVELYKVLKSKYGDPDGDYGIPEWYSLKDLNSDCAAYWTKGDKVIQMRVENFRKNYYLNLEIFQSSISTKLSNERKERELKEEKESIQKAKELL